MYGHRLKGQGSEDSRHASETPEGEYTGWLYTIVLVYAYVCGPLRDPALTYVSAIGGFLVEHSRDPPNSRSLRIGPLLTAARSPPMAWSLNAGHHTSRRAVMPPITWDRHIIVLGLPQALHLPHAPLTHIRQQLGYSRRPSRACYISGWSSTW